MTIQDASNELFAWFEKEDSFEINRDIKKIVPIFDVGQEEEVTIAFRIALEKLEEAQLVASKDYDDKKYYVLEKHMDAFQQSIELGPWTAKFLAGEINEFCQLVDDSTDLCQTSSIQEKDIRNLVHIVAFYKQKVLEKEQIISGEPSIDPALLEAFSSGLSGQIEPAPKNSPDNEDDSAKKKKKK
jgi:hypothetical protein